MFRHDVVEVQSGNGWDRYFPKSTTMFVYASAGVLYILFLKAESSLVLISMNMTIIKTVIHMKKINKNQSPPLSTTIKSYN